MNFKLLMGATCTSLAVASFSADAALIDNGGGLIYDTVLDITWAQPDTSTTWDAANTRASELTLGGVSGWRLPYISVAAGAGPFTGSPVDCLTASEETCRDNEMGYMFYHNLGGTSGQEILTSDDPDLALFPTLQSVTYWSSTEVDSGKAWGYVLDLGRSAFGSKGTELPHWPVHAGNVGAVPVPAAVWLFGSGLLGLISIARRKKS